jgi:hypothetical protein
MVARVVVVDTSLRSLTASVVNDQPHETATQLSWLKSVLCLAGDASSTGQSCSRPPTEQAIVVSEDPSYSYDPTFQQDTEQDGQTFEALMQAYKVNVVVSGRLGWNGLYWALAPGVHSPCPGQAYPDPSQVPSPTSGPCSAVSAPAGVATALNAVEGVAAGLSNGQALAPPANCSGQGANATGTVPYVVAASAGGKFGTLESPATGSADQGFWHGYTIIRLDKSGDPRCTIVETRPILDWVGIDAISHELEPGQHLQLHGYGREPAGYDAPVQYDSINSYAITHRYDLVEANPGAPWLPKVDPASPAPNHYVPLDPSVGTINPVTGFIQTGSGSHPRVYALAILSVGDNAAGWPIAFEPSKSFVTRKPILPQLPPVIPPPTAPAVHLAAAAPSPPPPPTSAPPSPPEVASPNLPQLPNLAPPPPVAAITPPAPPPPPVPPAPPGQPTPLPLALQAKLSPLGINATVVPPSPPPVNPAPPSGSAARKEAKQRQAATAKSEESAQEGVEQVGGDLAQGPPLSPGSGMSRLEHHSVRRARDRPVPSFTTRPAPSFTTRPAPSFTTLSKPDGPSLWIRDLLVASGLIMAALILALGFALLGPTSRRRRASQPAPARSWTPRRRL